MIMDMHNRFSHADPEVVAKAINKGRVKDIVDYQVAACTIEKCPTCMISKSRAEPSNEEGSSTLEPWTKIQADYTDLQIPTFSVARGYQIIVEAASKVIHVNLIKKKSENPGKIIDFIRKTQVAYNTKIHYLRTDGAAEYKSQEFQENLCKLDVEIQYSAPFCQEQNGLAERHIQTLNCCISAMIIGSGLPKPYWGEAALYAAYILNRTPRDSLNGKTPYEILTGKIPDIRMIHAFGCSTYCHIPKQQQTKFEPKVELCVLLGIQPNFDAFCLLCLSDLKIMVSRDVSFDDQTFPYQNRKSTIPENFDCTMRVTLDQEVTTAPSVTTSATPLAPIDPIVTPPMLGTPIGTPIGHMVSTPLS